MNDMERIEDLRLELIAQTRELQYSIRQAALLIAAAIVAPHITDVPVIGQSAVTYAEKLLTLIEPPTDK